MVILFVFFQTSCGDKSVSKEMHDFLTYSCTDDNVAETFSVRAFRYTGAEEGKEVYFHCNLRVCLVDVNNSACQCPNCDPSARKRRSLADEVDETKVYHTSTGPFIFKNDVEEKEEEGMKNSFLPAKLAFFCTAIWRRLCYVYFSSV